MKDTGCDKWREEIVGGVLNELDPERMRELEHHLRDCEACRLLHDQLAAEEVRLQAAFARLSPCSADVAAGSSPGPGARGNLAPRRRAIRLFFPLLATAGAAAALALMLGLWPAAAPVPRAYGMTDLPRLLQGAILHMTGRSYSSPNIEEEGEMLPEEYWYDLAQGRSRSGYSFYTWRGDHYVSGNGEQINDGSFIVTLNHTEKTASFERLDDYRRILENRRTFQNLFARFLAGRDRLDEFKVIGEEQIDGIKYDLWALSLPTYELRCALARDSGEIGYIKESHRRSNGQWRELDETGKWERLETAPAGVFDTTPPADYVLQNTKETAPLRELRYLGRGRSASVLHDRYTGFRLLDNSIIYAWSSRDTQDDRPQADAFAGLTFGGPLPALPYQIVGVQQSWGDKSLEYVGRHLAWTRSGESFVEWGLYVPRSDLRLPDWQSQYRAITKFNLPPERISSALEDIDFVAGPITIDNAADFDLLVRGEMAALSDDTPPPAEITLQNVTDLAARVRQELRDADNE